MATRIAAADLTWLLMDRPNNLMHVNGLIGFDEVPDFDAFASAIWERMVEKYRVLSQVPVHRDGHWWWEDDVHFDIGRHVRQVELPDASLDAVRAYVSEQFALPFDREHPLWEMQLISSAGSTAGFVYSRFHHGLGDGIRLVQMLIGACDPAEGATPPAVGRGTDGHHHPLEQVVHVVETSVTDTVDYVQRAGKSVGKGLLQAGRSLVATTNPLTVAQQVGGAVGGAVGLARHPVRLLDAVTSFGSVDNEWSNSWRELGRMVLSDGSEAGAWSGRPGREKSVAWLEGHPLDGIRAAAKAHDATLNDTLMAAVSLALTDYLEEQGVEDVRDLSWLMPVSLQPVDGGLPPELGNHFVVVMLSMPLGLRDHGELLAELHERSARIKHSAEPAVAFGVQQVVAEAPSVIARRVTDFFSSKTIGQLSNVPGPRVAMALAGAPVRSILGWVPTSGDQPIGICLFSYDGKVNIGVAADSRMIPDPARIVDLVEAHLVALAEAAPA